MIRRKTRLRGDGFTIVELLVVISIIALLLAMTLPSLKKARRAARAAVCQANMRTLAQAATAYSQDWGRYPPTLMNTPGDWITGWSRFDWLGAGHGGYERWVAPEHGVIWSSVRATEVYRCPEDRGAGTDMPRSFSYSLNGRTGLLVPDAYTRHQAKPNLSRLAPAALPLFAEEDEPLEGCFSGRDQPTRCHNDRSQIAYADAHVDRVSLAPGTTANQLFRDIEFDPPLTVVPDPEE
jgi:prepilin-type N-terminal cleavage/methylation domain-containing protein/prepilin-type processing-associated H-X9-DG protein